MEKEKNMVNGTWYAKHTGLWNCWVVKQFGGSFLKNEDGSVARFKNSEASTLVESLNNGVTL